MKIHLKVVEGRPRGASIPLQGPAFLIGRSPECNLRPKHESVGSRHCRLQVRDGQVSVRDLGTEGGTLLNGRRLKPAEAGIAVHGDRLQVGNLVFEVSVGGRGPNLSPTTEDESQDSTPASIARRLIQRSLGQSDDPIQGVGTRLRAELLEGVPFVTIEIVRIDDEAAVSLFKRDLRNLGDRPSLNRIILSFRKVKTFSPEAADVLFTFHERVRNRGAMLKLCDLAPEVMQVLDIKDLTTRMAICLDGQDALWSSW